MRSKNNSLNSNNNLFLPTGTCFWLSTLIFNAVNSVVKLLQGPHRIGIFCLLLVIIFLLPVAYCEARFVEGVVAFVDDAAITWGELNENYERVKKTKAVTVKEEVLNTMINRLLLLSEAKRLKIEAKTEEDIRNEYIDLKIRSVVRISEGDMEDFYNKNLSEFKDETFEAVRGRIEDYLTELEINKKLKKHIEELRAKAYVKIIRE